ncbi:MAG: hypothetical protein ABIP97_10230 [Chthoniobacterales bacterium]
MNTEPSSSPDLSGIDLSFAPAWAKESEPSKQIARLVARHGGREERPERPERRGGEQRRSDRPQGRRPEGRNRPSQRDNNRPPREARPEPIAPLSGWEIKFLPHPNGIEGLARQIKAASKTYPLFDLARLVLEKSERYRVEFKPASSSAPTLFQLQSDGSVWMKESEALSHALAQQVDAFYRRERITVDPPKGSYSFVAVCGMSGTVLGPPNYHDFQDKIRKLHSEKFKNVPFDQYKSRIRNERDEALVEKWKEEQSARDVFYPVNTPEGEEPLKLESLAAVEAHFRKHHASTAIVPVTDRILVPGPAAMNDSAPAALLLTRGNCDELIRFPLPLAHILGEQLAAKGLQVFKTHDNITCVGVARPRYLDRQATPVSDRLEAILGYLEAHASTPRTEQWKALTELYPLPNEGPDTREAAMATDLLWLLHEGHVIDYAGRGLEVTHRRGQNTVTSKVSPA